MWMWPPFLTLSVWTPPLGLPLATVIVALRFFGALLEVPQPCRRAAAANATSAARSWKLDKSVLLVVVVGSSAGQSRRTASTRRESRADRRAVDRTRPASRRPGRQGRGQAQPRTGQHGVRCPPEHGEQQPEGHRQRCGEPAAA